LASCRLWSKAPNYFESKGNHNMSSRLKEAVVQKDEKAVEQLISSLDQESFSLVTTIDELLPLMLMESNLRFGNFHLAKMALFLRKLAIEGYFSKATEKELARVVALEVVERECVSINASRVGYAKRDISSLAEKMIEELNENNVHNAFYYALGFWQESPDALMQTLLTLGASAIPNSLGHSLSCFFPVVEAVISVDHPAAASGLLSYLMYLARHQVSKEVLQQEYGQAESPLDYDGFLKLCASGNGVLNIHHTITFFVATEWEHAAFNKDGSVPYGLLLNWVGNKKVDTNRERRMTEEILQYTGKLPETYEEFSQQFSFEKLDQSIPCVFQLLDETPQRCVDWLFRIYASYYTRDWDPHYYTGLYSALRFYLGNKIRDEVARRMAIEQAIYYFAEDIT
jgi:hypothetical protein